MRAITRVKPGLIRIQADEVTYGMHVMLRFELEQDIVEGRVELRDLPQRWNEKMWDYLGVEVPDDGARRPPGRPLVRRDRSATSRRT